MATRLTALALLCACSGSTTGGSTSGATGGDGSCAGHSKTVLATGNGIVVPGPVFVNALRLAQTSTHLYWIDEEAGLPSPKVLNAPTGVVRRVAKAGGSVEEYLTPDADNVLTGLFSDGSTLFVLAGQSVAPSSYDLFLFKVIEGSTRVLSRVTPGRARGFDALVTAIVASDADGVLIATGQDYAAVDDHARLIRVNLATGDDTSIYDDGKRPAGVTQPLAILDQVSREGADYYFVAAQGVKGLWRIAASGVGSASVVTADSLAAIPTLVGGGYVFTSGLSLTRRSLAFADPTVVIDGIKDYEAPVQARLVDNGKVVVAVTDSKPSPLLAVDPASKARTVLACDGVGYHTLLADSAGYYWVDGTKPAGLAKIAR